MRGALCLQAPVDSTRPVEFHACRADIETGMADLREPRRAMRVRVATDPLRAIKNLSKKSYELID